MSTKYGVSIDGGGALGIGPAYFMSLYGDMVEYEDFLCGTSTGSILVAMRATGKSWNDIHYIFSTEVAKVFEKPSLLWRLNPLKPKYDNKNLKELLYGYLGNIKISDSLCDIYIPVSDLRTGKTKVYDREDDELLANVVLKSCSAPTYFPPIANRYVDGGLWANNPCMCGVAGYLSDHKDKVDLKDLKVLSLSSNGDYFKGYKVSGNMSLVRWLRPIIDFELNCTEDAANFIAKALLADDNYLRIDPVLDNDYQLDDLSRLDEYISIWKKYIREHEAEIKQFFRVYVNPDY